MKRFEFRHSDGLKTIKLAEKLMWAVEVFFVFMLIRYRLLLFFIR